MNKKQIALEILITLIVILIIIFTVILSLKQMGDQIISYCDKYEWHANITGEFEISCEQLYETEYANGKWADKCSLNPFSPKPSCHYFCVKDCLRINNQNNGSEYRCVC